MQLYYSERSPYARKVRAVAIEKGIQLELIEVMPLELPAELVAKNPLSKIPVLVTDDGDVIYDSPVICEYLDEIGQGQRLMPASGRARFQAQTWAALADGIIDAGVGCLYESMRPEGKQYDGWYDKQRAVILRGIQGFEARPELLAQLSIATIGLACAIDYADHRVASLGQPIAWRETCPNVAKWLDGFLARDCMTHTTPASWERATRAA